MLDRITALTDGLFHGLGAAAAASSKTFPANARILTSGYMGVGDFLLYSSFLKALKRQYPSASISVMAGPYSAAKELVPLLPEIDHLIEIDWVNADAAERIAALHKITAGKFDAFIGSYFTPVRFFLPAFKKIPFRAGLTRRIQYPHKILNPFGYAAWLIDQNFIEEDFFRRALYSVQVPVDQKPEHELSKLKRLAAALGINTNDWPVPLLNVPAAAQSSADHKLSKVSVTSPEKFIAVHPSASSAQAWKSWPAERYAQTIERLVTEKNSRIVLLGTADEQTALKATAPQLFSSPRISSLMGQTNLLEAAAVLKRAALFFGTDSGLGHLSIAVGTTAVRIFGPSDQPGFAAWSAGAHEDVFIDIECRPCLVSGVPKPGQLNYTCCPHRNCLNTLDVARVMTVLEKKLQ